MSNDTSGVATRWNSEASRTKRGMCSFAFCDPVGFRGESRAQSHVRKSNLLKPSSVRTFYSAVCIRMAYTWYHLHPGFGWELLYSLQEPACRDSCFELRLWVLFSIVWVIRRRYGVQKAHTPFSDAASFQGQLSLRKSVYHGRPRDLGEGQ